MKPALHILCMISLLSIGSRPLAQESPQQPRYYDIEIIVFTRNLEGAGSTESWPPLDAPPDWSRALRLNSGATAHAEDGTASNSNIVELPATGHRLRKEYQRLEATGGGLRPVVHMAWRQPILEKDASIPVYVRSRERSQRISDLAGETFPELEGTVHISGKRYLHVHLDLLLQRLAPPDLTSEEETEDADTNLFAPRYQAYRMIDHRRMRSDRLHYIDHPLIGVLILATAYEVSEPEKTEPRADLASTPQQTETSDVKAGAAVPSDDLTGEPGAQATQP